MAERLFTVLIFYIICRIIHLSVIFLILDRHKILIIICIFWIILTLTLYGGVWESPEFMIISIIRTILLYIIIIFAVRMMGKRQISELQTSELVVTLLMSNIASIPMQDTDQSMISGVLPIMVLLVCEILISYLMMKRAKIRKIICGKPVIVINDGKIDQDAMVQLRISTEDLYEQMRQKDVFNIDDIAYAILETNGKMSILKKPGKETVSAEQMGIKTTDSGLQTVIISDGEIAKNSMKFCGIDEKWLYDILKKEKIMLNDIFIMTCDKKRSYKIIKKERK